MSDELLEGGGGVWREVLAFLLRFLAVSIPLYIVYTWVGSYYTVFTASCAKPFLGAFGIDIRVDRVLSVTEEISLNPVVFLSLVVAVRRIGWLSKLKGAVIGLLILTAANIIVVFFLFMSAHRQSEGLWTGTEFLNLTINFFLPLLLWFLLLPVRSYTLLGIERESAPRDTGSAS